MSKHAGDTRSFSQLSKDPIESKNFPDNVVDKVVVGLYSPRGVTSGEFTIEFKNNGEGKCIPTLNVPDDAWSALLSFNDLLLKFAMFDGKNITPKKLCETLRTLGMAEILP